MTKQKPKRGLGRGLSALIPESDIDFLKSVARGDSRAEPVITGNRVPSAGADRDGFHPASLTDTLVTQERPTDAAGSTPPTAAGEPNAHENHEVDIAGGSRSRILHVEIASVEANPFQPRQVFDEEELQQLADSIRDHGILQPVLLRPIPAPHPTNPQIVYQLIAGERRWRACARAGLQFVPAIVRTVNDLEALELALIENVQRHDIGPVESAEAYRRMAREFEISQEEIARRVGKSRASVANTIRLLDLPQEAIEALKGGQITEGHGRALLTASGDGGRRALLRRVLRDGLSVREVERLARIGEDAETPNVAVPPLSAMRTPDLERLERTLQKALGTRLKLKPRRRGGQIIIDFFSPEDLQRLVKRLTGLDGSLANSSSLPAGSGAGIIPRASTSTLAEIATPGATAHSPSVSAGSTAPSSSVPPTSVTPTSVLPGTQSASPGEPPLSVPVRPADVAVSAQISTTSGSGTSGGGAAREKMVPNAAVSPPAISVRRPGGGIPAVSDPSGGQEQKRFRPATEAVRLTPLAGSSKRKSTSSGKADALPAMASKKKKTHEKHAAGSVPSPTDRGTNSTGGRDALEPEKSKHGKNKTGKYSPSDGAGTAASAAGPSTNPASKILNKNSSVGGKKR